jgi:hypothetical protein
MRRTPALAGPTKPAGPVRKATNRRLNAYARPMSPLRTVYFAMVTLAACAHGLFTPLREDHSDLYRLVIGHGPDLMGAALLGVLIIALFVARFERRIAGDPQRGDLMLVAIGWGVCLALLVGAAMLSSNTVQLDAAFGGTYSVTMRPGLHSVLSAAIVFGCIDAVAAVLRLRGTRLDLAMARANVDAPPSSQARG